MSPREAAPSALHLGAHGSVCADVGHLLLGSSRTGSVSALPCNTSRPESGEADTQARPGDHNASPGINDPNPTHRGLADRCADDCPDHSARPRCHVRGLFANRYPTDGDDIGPRANADLIDTTARTSRKTCRSGDAREAAVDDDEAVTHEVTDVIQNQEDHGAGHRAGQ